MSNIYPNAPLVEAVFEIRFPGKPAIECRRDLFFEKVRQDYPRVVAPQIQPGQSLSLLPYQFQKEDKSSQLLVAIHLFAYSTSRYEGFARFKEEALKYCRLFLEEFHIRKLDRTGLRYINIIPFVRQDNLFPLEKYLRVSLKLPELIPLKFQNLGTYFVSETNGGTITTRIEPLISQDKSRKAILLDFDFAKEKGLNADMLEEYLDESHEYTKELFEQLVTEEYGKVIRGETI